MGEAFLSGSDILDLQRQLDQAERDAGSLVEGLTEEQGVRRAGDHSWSVAQCLEHLARTNGVYLQAMGKAADVARERSKFRRRPAVPGPLGRWFVRTVEPPARAPFKVKAPGVIDPGEAVSLGSASEHFRLSQDQVRAFLTGQSDLDLASIHFPNPFLGGLRFTLATGLHILAAHERRHLWQAWQARRGAGSV